MKTCACCNDDCHEKAKRLEREYAELDAMLMRWFKAAEPYATPGSLENGMRKLRNEVIEECADLADQKLDHFSGTECTYRCDVAGAIRGLKNAALQVTPEMSTSTPDVTPADAAPSGDDRADDMRHALELDRQDALRSSTDVSNFGRTMEHGTGGRWFHVCEDHKNAGWNQPELDADACVLCRLFYLEAQESLLEEWQQRAKRAEAAIEEVQRPLDAQMARLNETVTRLNAENERLRNQSAIGRTERLEALLREALEVLPGRGNLRRRIAQTLDGCTDSSTNK